jgi:hypothetical protein
VGNATATFKFTKQIAAVPIDTPANRASFGQFKRGDLSNINFIN